MFEKLVDKVRRKLAGLVLGERFALFVPSHVKSVQDIDYLALDDVALAALSRRWLLAIKETEVKLAGEKALPVSVFVTSNAAMNLIRHAIEIGADEVAISQNGSIKGQDIGAWRIDLKRLPDDFEFGQEGVRTIQDIDGKIKQVSYSFTL